MFEKIKVELERCNLLSVVDKMPF